PGRRPRENRNNRPAKRPKTGTRPNGSSPMGKAYFLSLLGVLLSTGLVLGQARGPMHRVDEYLAPPSGPQPAPAAVGEALPAPTVVGNTLPPLAVLEGLNPAYIVWSSSGEAPPPPACGPGVPTGAASAWTASVEYLFWFVKGENLPF